MTIFSHCCAIGS